MILSDYLLKYRSLVYHLRKTAVKEENALWYDFLMNYPVQFYRQALLQSKD